MDLYFIATLILCTYSAMFALSQGEIVWFLKKDSSMIIASIIAVIGLMNLALCICIQAQVPKDIQIKVTECKVCHTKHYEVIK